jgi:hypothetical protein
MPMFMSGRDFDFAVNMDKAVLFDPETENAYRVKRCVA